MWNAKKPKRYPCPRFELRSACPFSTTLTITPQVLPHMHTQKKEVEWTEEKRQKVKCCLNKKKKKKTDRKTEMCEKKEDPICDMHIFFKFIFIWLLDGAKLPIIPLKGWWTLLPYNFYSSRKFGSSGKTNQKLKIKLQLLELVDIT